MLPIYIDWIVVILLGALVALGEILSRYRDDPLRVCTSISGIVYLSLNGLASCVALLLIQLFDVKFGIDATKEPAKLRVVQVLTAGLAAIAFFRSSLFNFRVGDRDVPIGPNLVLQIIFQSVDREIDRMQATHRGVAIAQIMRNVKFTKAKTVLPAYCLGLMQNVSPEEQTVLQRQIQGIAQNTDPALTDDIKSALLGLALLPVVGEEVLAQTVKTLGTQIT